VSRVANQLRVPRIIDGELWTQAHPSGVAFLAPDGGPPGLGIVFDDAAAGIAIFEDWLTELGPEDEDELIRVAIVEGEVAGQPGYSVEIEVDVDSISDALAGSDLDGVDVEADGLGSVRWRMRTPPGGSPELAAWKRRFADAGRYALVPVIDDGDGLEPAYELQLVKRKLVFERAAADAAARSTSEDAMTITPERLARWSEQLCTLPALDIAQAMAALGIPGAAVWRTASYAVVEPAPPGASRLALVLEHLGPNAGHLGSIQVVPSAPITRAAVDRELGPGEEEPPIADGPDVVAYDVRISGAAFTCSVSALFDGEPTPEAAAREIRLRRDPVMPAPATSDEARR
jgi:hypothetical protein